MEHYDISIKYASCFEILRWFTAGKLFENLISRIFLTELCAVNGCIFAFSVLTIQRVCIFINSSLWCCKVAEYELSAFLFSRLLPNIKNIVYAHIYLRIWIIRQ